MKNTFITLSLLIGMGLSSYAQSGEKETKELPVCPIQVSLITPLGTNGLQSGRYVNRLSFNLLGGVARGLDGIEISGIFAVETEDVKGLQLAGISNIVGGSIDGIQSAGIANVIGGEVKGIQFAGNLNVVGQRVHGAQFAGIANLVGQELEGAQFAGIANIAANIDGAQLSGIVNISTGNVKGAQVGLINLANHVDGVQVGLINFAKDGYRRGEFWGSDVLHANFGYKMGGNRKLYNIFTVGAALPNETSTRWGYGMGIGTNFTMGKKTQLSIEGITYHIKENDQPWMVMNQLNQLRSSFIIPLKGKVAFTLTPTFNVQVSRHQTLDGRIGSEWVSWNIYNKLVNGKTRVMMWPGLNAGIQF